MKASIVSVISKLGNEEHSDTDSFDPRHTH